MNNNLFSIYIQKEQLGTQLPRSIEQHIQSFTSACSNISQTHHLLGDAEIREIIRKHYGNELLRSYECVVPDAYKADIGRYAVLHAYGGTYADLAMIFLNPPAALTPLEKGCISHGIRKPNIYNGFLMANAGDPLLATALDLINQRVTQRYYGPNPVSITGPRLLADALTQCQASDYRFYQVQALTPELANINMAVLDDEGRIICLRNKRKVGGIEELGLPSSDYRELWAARQVYR